MSSQYGLIIETLFVNLINHFESLEIISQRSLPLFLSSLVCKRL